MQKIKALVLFLHIEREYFWDAPCRYHIQRILSKSKNGPILYKIDLFDKNIVQFDKNIVLFDENIVLFDVNIIVLLDINN